MDFAAGIRSIKRLIGLYGSHNDFQTITYIETVMIPQAKAMEEVLEEFNEKCLEIEGNYDLRYEEFETTPGVFPDKILKAEL